MQNGWQRLRSSLYFKAFIKGFPLPHQVPLKTAYFLIFSASLPRLSTAPATSVPTSLNTKENVSRPNDQILILEEHGVSTTSQGNQILKALRVQRPYFIWLVGWLVRLGEKNGNKPERTVVPVTRSLEHSSTRGLTSLDFISRINKRVPEAQGGRAHLTGRHCCGTALIWLCLISSQCV